MINIEGKKFAPLPVKVADNAKEIRELWDYINKNGYSVFSVGVNVGDTLFVLKTDVLDVGKELHVGDFILGLDGYISQITDLGINVVSLGTKVQFGILGPEGPQGVGIQGPKGDQGAQGIQGIQGDAGADGVRLPGFHKEAVRKSGN